MVKTMPKHLAEAAHTEPAAGPSNPSATASTVHIPQLRDASTQTDWEHDVPPTDTASDADATPERRAPTPIATTPEAPPAEEPVAWCDDVEVPSTGPEEPADATSSAGTSRSSAQPLGVMALEAPRGRGRGRVMSGPVEWGPLHLAREEFVGCDPPAPYSDPIPEVQAMTLQEMLEALPPKPSTSRARSSDTAIRPRSISRRRPSKPREPQPSTSAGARANTARRPPIPDPFGLRALKRSTSTVPRAAPPGDFGVAVDTDRIERDCREMNRIHGYVPETNEHFSPPLRLPPPARRVPGCYNCRSREHNYTNCPEPPQRQFCYRCGMPDSTLRTCNQCKDEWRAFVDTYEYDPL